MTKCNTNNKFTIYVQKHKSLAYTMTKTSKKHNYALSSDISVKHCFKKINKAKMSLQERKGQINKMID